MVPRWACRRKTPRGGGSCVTHRGRDTIAGSARPAQGCFGEGNPEEPAGAELREERRPGKLDGREGKAKESREQQQQARGEGERAGAAPQAACAWRSGGWCSVLAPPPAGRVTVEPACLAFPAGAACRAGSALSKAGLSPPCGAPTPVTSPFGAGGCFSAGRARAGESKAPGPGLCLRLPRVGSSYVRYPRVHGCSSLGNDALLLARVGLLLSGFAGEGLMGRRTG